jgi:L-aspartate oxidase
VRTDFPDRDDVWQRTSLVVGLDTAGRPVVLEETAVAA